MYVSIFRCTELYSKLSMSAHCKMHNQNSNSSTLAFESMFLCSTVCVCVCVSVCFLPLNFWTTTSWYWLNSETYSVQFRSVAQSCPTLCDPMNRSMTGLPVHHQLPEFTQIHVHQVSDAIQPSHPLSSPSPPASNPSQHQGLFQWVNSSHVLAKVLEFQL